MKSKNELEKLGKIYQIQEELRELKQSISELKEAIISSFNEPFKPFLWERLTTAYKQDQAKTQSLTAELNELKNETGAKK